MGGGAFSPWGGRFLHASHFYRSINPAPVETVPCTVLSMYVCMYGHHI